jgi:hypothetical protein
VALAAEAFFGRVDRPTPGEVSMRHDVLGLRDGSSIGLLQGFLQVVSIQLNGLLEGPLEGLSFHGCTKAARTTEVCPPARGCLCRVMHGLVLRVQHQPMEQPFGLLLSTPEACSNGPQPFVVVQGMTPNRI